MNQSLKSKPYQLKAASAYTKRKKDAGYVVYSRFIKLEWKEKLDDLLSALKKENTPDI